MSNANVKFGYAILLPLESISEIPGTILVLLNIIWENAIDKHDKVIEKDCLTHTQSYCLESGTSVNSWMQQEELLLCLFRATQKHPINWSGAARAQFSQAQILAAEFVGGISQNCIANLHPALTESNYNLLSA